MKALVSLALALFSATSAQGAPATWTEPVTGMAFVAVAGGCYQMGNPNALALETDNQFIQLGLNQARFADEAPVHEVCLDPFWVGRYEVTAKQWQTVMGEAPPVGEKQAPTANISWQQAQAFIKQLNERSQGEERFRLPTEAEWEYACRAGSPPAENRPNKQTLAEKAWFSSSAARVGAPGEVGQLMANPWGLADMLGNVWEWTADNYRDNGYLEHSLRNPVVEGGDAERVIRGGSFQSLRGDVRCASRGFYQQDASLRQIGLRLVRSEP